MTLEEALDTPRSVVTRQEAIAEVKRHGANWETFPLPERAYYRARDILELLK